MPRKTIFVLIIITVLLTSANTCDPGTSSTPAQNLLNLINENRQAADCKPVQGNDQLRAAAERHVVDIRDHPAIREDPLHLGSDGSTPNQRIAQAGYTPAAQTGEIMYYALGPPGNNERANISWWMNSAPHAAIIRNCAFTHAGVGLVYPGGTQWFSVVDFGAH
jgi:uncharacterized protein YkwD